MISCFNWFGYILPLKERIDLIKRAGFDGVMFWWSDEFGNPDYRDNPRLARDAGLFVENIHTPFSNVNNLWVDSLEGIAEADLFLRIVDECRDYEIPAMVMHLSQSDPPPYNTLGLDRIKRIIDRAERLGINVAFENLRDPGSLEFVMNNIDSQRAGFCFDSGHQNYATPDHDLLRKYGPRLMALHLHDNDGTEDQHKLPFDGTIDWHATMTAIGQLGYTGPVSLESDNTGHEDMPPDSYLRLAHERAKTLESMMYP